MERSCSLLFHINVCLATWNHVFKGALEGPTAATQGRPIGLVELKSCTASRPPCWCVTNRKMLSPFSSSCIASTCSCWQLRPASVTATRKLIGRTMQRLTENVKVGREALKWSSHRRRVRCQHADLIRLWGFVFFSMHKCWFSDSAT